MSASIGTLGKLGIGATSTVDKRLNYKDETFIREDEVIDGNGIRGSLSSDAEPVRDGPRHYRGPVNLVPNAVEWGYLLEWIMGGTPTVVGSVTTYPLADTAVTKYLTIDRKVKVFNYTGVGVKKATFRAAKGTNLSLALDLIGQSGTIANTGTFPAISFDKTTKPFVFHDLVLTVAGTSPVSCAQFELSIDNMIDEERFFNSLELTAINKLDRVVMFSTTVPYGDYSALRAAMNAGANGMAVTAVFTNGNSVLTFTLPGVAIPQKDADTPGRVEIMQPLAGRAYAVAGVAELSISLNPTP